MLLSPGTGGIVLQIFLILSSSSSFSILAEESSQESNNNPDEENSSGSAEYGPEYYSSGEQPAGGSKKNKENLSSGYDPSNYPDNPADLEYFYTPIEFDGESGEPAGTQQKPKKVDPFAPLKRAFFAKDAEPQYKYSGSKPGPYYTSYEYPKTYFGGAGKAARENDKSSEERDAKSSNNKDVESVPPVVKNSRTEPKIDGVDHTSAYKRYKDSYDRFEAIRDAERQLAEQSKKKPTQAYYNGKNVDYNTGKSSSTVSQPQPYPETAQTTYKDDSLPKPDAEFNVEPVDINYEALQSSYLENLEKLMAKQEKKKKKKEPRLENVGGLGQPTEKVAEILEGCKKVTSPENMNCVVCEDAATKSKYTQCTYSASEDPINQYTAGSVRYSVPANVPGNFRYRRSIYEEEHDRDNPYFEIAQRSKKYFEDYEKEQEKSASNPDKDFYYNPYKPNDYESYSESQSTDLLKIPGACTKVEREGATCTVCRDEESGGNFEQCSYVSKPKESKYAYVAEKKFDSDDEPEKSEKESTEEESQKKEAIVAPATPSVTTAAVPSNNNNVKITAPAAAAASGPIPELIEAASNVASEASPEGSEDQSDSIYQSPYYGYHPDGSGSADSNRYDIPEHFESTIQKKQVAKGRGSGEEDDDDSFNQYRYTLFPDLYKSAETNDNEAKVVVPERKKQDVEEVLAEFAKKDRSKCQKAEKNGMTCFLCVDQNKVQNEECMYIAESKPKATHVAYHGLERLKDPSSTLNDPIDLNARGSAINDAILDISNNDKTHLVSEKSKRKKYFKKNVVVPVHTGTSGAGRSATVAAPIDLSGAASQVYNERVPYESASNRRQKKRKYNPEAAASAPDTETLDSNEPSDSNQKQKSEEPEPPKEIDVGDEEGAYTHETKPVYSKLFDTTLPRYMIEKTEFEKDFDAEAGFD